LTPDNPNRRVTRFWPFPNLFYGWAIVWSGLIVSIAQAPVYGPVVSIFMKPIADETGWSRAEISLGFTIGSIVGTFGGAPVGMILDRVGSRGLVTVAGLVISGSLVALATMTETWQLWLFMGAGRGIAMSGVQMGTMVAVTNWFVIKRGRAAAIPSFGVRAGQAIVPLAILPIIVTYGWREAYWALSLGALLFVAVPAWIFLRRRPEDHGLFPDGITPEPPSPSRQAAQVASEVRWTLREATHTRAFWLLIIVTATGMFGQTAANLHVVANFQDQGMTVALSITIPAIFAGVSAVSTFAWGYAIERLQARPALAVVAVLNTIGMAILVNGASSYPVAVVYAIIAGLAGGGFLVAQRVIWADYYGRFSVGTIRGFASLFIGFVGPIGPLLAGVMYDQSGTYTVAFTIAGLLFAIGFIAMLFAPRPIKPQQT